MKKIKLDFGTFDFYPDVIIAQINEGVHFDLEHYEILSKCVNDHYGADHKLGYISLRKHSYSVDPMVYFHNRNLERLVSIGIVEDTIKSFSSAALEGQFFKPKRLKSFSTTEEALYWTNHQLKQEVDLQLS